MAFDELRRALEAHEEALKERTRERDALAWATTKNNLGATLAVLGQYFAVLGQYLAVLGQNDDDAAALRKVVTCRAVTAFKAALKERTRERVPLYWADTKNNLGGALQTLGELGDVEASRRAVTASEAALQECTRERLPLAWAKIQNNLGGALAAVGERGDPEALRRAEKSLRGGARRTKTA